MLEAGSSGGSTARFSVQQFIAKSLQMCGKGHRLLLQQFGRKQGHRPKPFSSNQAATKLASSTKVTTQNPSKDTPNVAKTLPKSRCGWGGGLFPVSALITLWPTRLASPCHRGRGRYGRWSAGLPGDRSIEGHGSGPAYSFCLPRAPVSPCVTRDRSQAKEHSLHSDLQIHLKSWISASMATRAMCLIPNPLRPSLHLKAGHATSPMPRPPHSLCILT